MEVQANFSVFDTINVKVSTPHSLNFFIASSSGQNERYAKYVFLSTDIFIPLYSEMKPLKTTSQFFQINRFYSFRQEYNVHLPRDKTYHQTGCEALDVLAALIL